MTSGAFSSKESALAVREAVISLLTSEAALETVQSFSSGETTPRPRVIGCLPDDLRQVCHSEITQITTWSEERWALRSDNSVALVDKQEFEATPASLRFSYSDSLRTGVEPALAVRGLLSGIRSRDVADAFSHAYGDKIEYKSSDVARYRDGHYLRRHADTFADRVFGVLTFLSPDWSHSHGGELVVEAPDGSVDCIAPEPGTLAMLPIRPGFQHLVSRIRTSDWVRFSVASHFSKGGSDSSKADAGEIV